MSFTSMLSLTWVRVRIRFWEAVLVGGSSVEESFPLLYRMVESLQHLCLPYEMVVFLEIPGSSKI